MLELQGRGPALREFALGNGARLGPYRLGPEIATGGMAAVHLGCLEGAHGFGRLVAIKRIHPHLAREREFVEMFLDEARIAARVSHPFVASVTDFGEWQGQPYITMELLFGEPISRVLSAVSKHPQEVAAPHYRLMVTRLIADLCEGLHAAHEVKDDAGNLLGVIHRDISPTNLLVLYSGTPKILDFGIARAQNRLHQTLPGSFKGKLAYAAPEVLLGESYDRRSDIWSMGVVLWEMLTTSRLFWGETDLERIVAVTKGRIPPPSERQPTIPPELEAVTMMALQRDPTKRYQTARAMSRDLERFLGHWGDSVPHADVADWIGALFPGAAERKQQLLRKAFSLTPDMPASTVRVGGARPVAASATPVTPAPRPPPSALDSVKTELQPIPPGSDGVGTEMQPVPLPPSAVAVDGRTLMSAPASVVPDAPPVTATLGWKSSVRGRVTAMGRSVVSLVTGKKAPEDELRGLAFLPPRSGGVFAADGRRSRRATRPMVLAAIGVAGTVALIGAVRFQPTPQAGWPAAAQPRPAPATPQVAPPPQMAGNIPSSGPDMNAPTGGPPAAAPATVAAAAGPAAPGATVAAGPAAPGATVAAAAVPAAPGATGATGSALPGTGPAPPTGAPAATGQTPPTAEPPAAPSSAATAPGGPGTGAAAAAAASPDGAEGQLRRTDGTARRRRSTRPWDRPVPVTEGGEAAVEPSKGQLLVRTPDGPAEVFYKGRLLTNTPALLTFPPGEHELEIRRTGAEEAYPLMVTVKAGETVVYDVREQGGAR
jgi:serine/threonine protein kinase